MAAKTIIKVRAIRVVRFLRKLEHLLSDARKTYDQYHTNGKIYRCAKKLKKQNNKIKVLVSRNLRFLKFYTNKKDAYALLEHIDEWSRLWDLEFQIKQPKEEDKFLFESKIRFPRKSVSALINSRKLYVRAI